jgi:hypothetical protein
VIEMGETILPDLPPDMTPEARIAEAERYITAACIALTRASCLLGFSEGRRGVSVVHGLVYAARTAVIELMARRVIAVDPSKSVNLADLLPRRRVSDQHPIPTAAPALASMERAA